MSKAPARAKMRQPVPPMPLAVLVIFVGLYALATLRGVHLGVVMLPAAFVVGVGLVHLAMRDITTGFPVGIMLLLVGVTYFFGMAQANGTIDRLIASALGSVGGGTVGVPLAMFGVTLAVSSMGAPLAGLVMTPVAMRIAQQKRIDQMLMGLVIGTSTSAGGFAPTSLFGIVTYGTARQASIPLSPFVLFAVALAANLAILGAGFVLYGRRTGHAGQASGADTLTTTPMTFHQMATVACILCLVLAVIGAALAGVDADIGVLSLACAAVLTFIDPRAGAEAIKRIDWSTVLLVGGLLTFVGVLQKSGAVDMLGHLATTVSTPLVTALFICVVGGLVSAFASTTGILAALVPLALPVISAGGLSGWALISSLAVCASLVDLSPYSTTGATVVASGSEDQRQRLTTLMTRWGFALVILGPLVLVGLLVAPASLGK